MALRILVADDAAFVRDTIKRTLRSFLQNAEIIDVTNGHRAVAALKANNVSLILSDWEMPEMTGEELLKWARSSEKYAKTPFIMISSRGDKDHVMKAVQAGVSDYMSKPFTPEELQNKVAKQLVRMGIKVKGMKGESKSSLDVLTGGGKKAQIQKPREVKDASAFFAKPVEGEAKPKSQAKPRTSFRERAYLRFADQAHQCAVSDISLQAMNAIIPRPQKMPCVFDQVVVDMENEQGEAIARLNAYVHSTTAADPRPNSERLKVIVRFVDNDPEKFELLSKLVTR